MLLEMELKYCVLCKEGKKSCQTMKTQHSCPPSGSWSPAPIFTLPIRIVARFQEYAVSLSGFCRCM